MPWGVKGKGLLHNAFFDFAQAAGSQEIVKKELNPTLTHSTTTSGGNITGQHRSEPTVEGGGQQSGVHKKKHTKKYGEGKPKPVGVALKEMFLECLIWAVLMIGRSK